MTNPHIGKLLICEERNIIGVVLETTHNGLYLTFSGRYFHELPGMHFDYYGKYFDFEITDFFVFAKSKHQGEFK